MMTTEQKWRIEASQGVAQGERASQPRQPNAESVEWTSQRWWWFECNVEVGRNKQKSAQARGNCWKIVTLRHALSPVRTVTGSDRPKRA